jgi:hypothetical protein
LKDLLESKESGLSENEKLARELKLKEEEMSRLLEEWQTRERELNDK